MSARTSEGGDWAVWLTALSETEAAKLGYATMYLHTSSDALATLAFWLRVGYGFIGVCETSSHFDKRIGVAAEAA